MRPKPFIEEMKSGEQEGTGRINREKDSTSLLLGMQRNLVTFLRARKTREK